MDELKIIAFYLPQFHAIPENDKWWGKGFTEWTNVGKAKPLFRGHYQPKVPADLGYYDLTNESVREQQAELAKEAGVYGFCYWHYWFGKGRRLLERPFNEVLDSGKPDFPFCLGWANESWQAKEWSVDKQNIVKSTLMEQLYPGEDDNKLHFDTMLPAFRDERYIRVENRPLFMICRPFKFDRVGDFIKQWNNLIKESGVADSFYFVGQANTDDEVDKIKALGFDAVSVNQSGRMQRAYLRKPLWVKALKKMYRKLFKKPLVIPYKDCIKYILNEKVDNREDVIPSLLPNWDHSPRSKQNCTVLHDSTPDLFEQHCDSVLSSVKKKKNQIVFLKSWNEWGEGNYMEPDLRYGHGYIRALAESIKKNS